MIAATQVRPGMVIKFNGELYSIFTMTHRTPGNLRGFVQVKMRNLRNGSMAEQRFGSTDRVEKASVDEKEMEYLYSDGAGHHFMDQTTYDQVWVPPHERLVTTFEKSAVLIQSEPELVAAPRFRTP